MTWPTGNIDSSRFDSDADRISTSRPELFKIAVDVNNIANTFDPAGAVANSVLAYSNSSSRFEPAVDLNLVSITAAGNITGNFFIGDGSQLTGLISESIANVSADATPELGGNLSGAGFGIANISSLGVTANASGVFVATVTNSSDTGGGLAINSGDGVGTNTQLIVRDRNFGNIRLLIQEKGNTDIVNDQINITGAVGVTGNISVTGNITANSITGDGSGLTGILTGITGNAVGNVDMAGFALQLDKYQERVFDLGNVTGLVAPNLANGTVQTATLTGPITMNGLTGAVAGSSMTLIFTQDAVGTRVLSSNMLAPGGLAGRTLSIAPNARDVVNIFYDGANYFMTVTQGFS